MHTHVYTEKSQAHYAVIALLRLWMHLSQDSDIYDSVTGCISISVKISKLSDFKRKLTSRNKYVKYNNQMGWELPGMA